MVLSIPHVTHSSECPPQLNHLSHNSLLLPLPAGLPPLGAPDVVRAHLVLQQPLLGHELVLAHVALEGLLARVVHLVQLQVLLRLQLLGAEPALELGVLVGQLVLLGVDDSIGKMT